MHRGGLGELLVGQVADRDDEIAVVPDVADVAGPQPGQRQAVASGGGDRAGIDRDCRVRSGRCRRDGAGPAPQRGRLDMREMEDIGDAALSYNEVKALATGNPLLLEKLRQKPS